MRLDADLLEEVDSFKYFGRIWMQISELRGMYHTEQVRGTAFVGL